MIEENTVYKLGAGLKLVPVSFDGAEIGMRVRYASDYGIYTIIGRESSGWTIANGKGETHSGQQIESLSPYTRIEILSNLPTATGAEIEALKQAVEEKHLEDKKESEIAQAQKQSDYERILCELKKKYPHADAMGSQYARAAKNLKRELKEHFPSSLFSVKSESFAGGSAVRVEWTDGATAEQVERIAGKYAYGSFDSSEDYYNYDGSAYAKAVQEYLGSVKYVSTTRNYSDEVKTRIKRELEESGITEHPNCDLERELYRTLQEREF